VAFFVRAENTHCRSELAREKNQGHHGASGFTRFRSRPSSERRPEQARSYRYLFFPQE
jgi:hypothetical protein